MNNNMANSNTVGAILPSYNSAEFLEQCLHSLTSQTIPFDEIIIINDGSTDNSAAIIASYISKHNNIKLIQHTKNLGVSHSINAGIDFATSDYLIFCGADDWYYPNIVELLQANLRQCPEAKLICGDAVIAHYHSPRAFRRNLPFDATRQLISPAKFEQAVINKYVFFNGSGGMFISRQAIIEAGKLQPELKWHCDWLLYFSIAFKYGVYYVDELFVKVNTRKNCYSEGKFRWQEQRDVLLSTLDKLKTLEPQLYNEFKLSALLPRYAPSYIIYFLLHKEFRSYMSIKLVKRMIIHNPVVIRMARMMPYPLVLNVRKLLKA